MKKRKLASEICCRKSLCKQHEDDFLHAYAKWINAKQNANDDSEDEEVVKTAHVASNAAWLSYHDWGQLKKMQEAQEQEGTESEGEEAEAKRRKREVQVVMKVDGLQRWIGAGPEWEAHVERVVGEAAQVVFKEEWVNGRVAAAKLYDSSDSRLESEEK